MWQLLLPGRKSQQTCSKKRHDRALFCMVNQWIDQWILESTTWCAERAENTTSRQPAHRRLRLTARPSLTARPLSLATALRTS